MNEIINEYQIGDKLNYKDNARSNEMEFIEYRDEDLEYIKTTPFNLSIMHGIENDISSRIYFNSENINKCTKIYIFDIYPEVSIKNVNRIVICVEYKNKKYYSIIRNDSYVKQRFEIDMKHRRCRNIDKLLNL